MKITSVELHTANSSDFATLSFRDPQNLNPYNVKGIDGLDADDIVPRYYGGSGGSAKFYNLTLEKRTLVVRIGLNPRMSQAESYSNLRDDLYRFISSSRTGLIEVQFKNALATIATISGFVTKFEAPHFEKTQEVKLTISCDDPLLRAPNPVTVDLDDLLPAETVITDAFSTAPHGFIFGMDIATPRASILITDPDDDSWSFEVTPAGGFLADDILIFSSEYNDKFLYLVRDLEEIHLADKISAGSVWPIIFPGVNTFSFDEPAGLSWTLIEYRPTYWGV